MKILALIKRGRQALFLLAAACLVITGLAGAWALYITISDNIHTVREGVLYRSAQLSAQSLENAIRGHSIATVINLRGAHPGEPWYQDEISVTKNLHVRHLDFKLSASRAPTMTMMAQLDKMMQDAPKPILIHCQGGADRSGLVAALYQHAIAGEPARIAENQLSFYYGHFPWFWSRSGAMDMAFKKFAAAPRSFIVGEK